MAQQRKGGLGRGLAALIPSAPSTTDTTGKTGAIGNGASDIIFGDEPTGNLDSNSSTEVLTTLRSVVDDYNQTVVTVTHDPRAASYADRVIFLTDGHIVDELTDPTTEAILTTMATIDNPDNQAS